MLTGDELKNQIPAEAKPYVDRLRNFLGDTEGLNILERVRESTDIELYQAIQDTLEEASYESGPFFPFTSITDFPSWNILKYGATMQILMSKGILSARNTVSYNDSGGVSINDYDKYGRYMNFYNMIQAKWMRGLGSIKAQLNADSAYGGIGSEYGLTGINI